MNAFPRINLSLGIRDDRGESVQGVICPSRLTKKKHNILNDICISYSENYSIT